jgi:hypothetical protein
MDTHCYKPWTNYFPINQDKEKMKFLTVAIIVLITLTSCNSEDKIDGYKSNEILVVTIDIVDNFDIEKITLTSTGGTDEILGNKIENRQKIKLKTPQLGEGTFKICIYTKTDSLCSQDSYIEGGYRPKLRLKNNKFETLEWN